MEIYFENTRDNHHKFYLLRMNQEKAGFTIYRQWGRIGSSGRVLVTHIPTREKARRLLREICACRLRHGYVPVYGKPVLSEKMQEKYGEWFATEHRTGKKIKQQLALPFPREDVE